MRSLLFTLGFGNVLAKDLIENKNISFALIDDSAKALTNSYEQRISIIRREIEEELESYMLTVDKKVCQAVFRFNCQ